MVAEVKFDQRKARTSRQAVLPTAGFEGLTGSSRSFGERLALHKHPSGNSITHDVAGGRSVGEKPALGVE
jgi:hypothetical protein